MSQKLILCLVVWVAVMVAAGFFLKWFLPVAGDAGFIVWIVGCFALTYWLEPNRGARE